MEAVLPNIHKSGEAKAGASNFLLLGYGLLILISFISYTQLWLSTHEQQFWFLTSVLAAHNLLEFYSLYKKESRHFWLKPVVLGAVVVFLLQHGALTNFLYRGLDGNFHTPYNDYLVREPVWLTRTMAPVLACSVVYWLGYKMRAGTSLGILYYNTYKPFWSFPLSQYKLLFGLIIGCIIKLILNYYGAIGHRFGYVLEVTGGIPPIIYRLKIFENLSLFFVICFMFLAIQYKRNMFYWVVFFAGLLFEAIFALTSGARSTIIFIFLGVFLVDYYNRGHLRWIWIAGGVGILIFAMTVLQDFKAFAMRESRDAASIKDPIAFIQSANNYRSQLEKTGQVDKSAKHAIYLTSVGRFNYVNEVTQVLRHKQVKGLKSTDPDFLGPFFTFPLFAVIPQYWILGKETEGYGAWVTDLLLNTRKYDIAMSPIGYSFMAGGVGLVLFIFFISGILMNALEFLFRRIDGVIGFILFIALLKILALFDTVVWANFLNLIRYGILLPPLLWFLLRRWPPTRQASD